MPIVRPCCTSRRRGRRRRRRRVRRPHADDRERRQSASERDQSNPPQHQVPSFGITPALDAAARSSVCRARCAGTDLSRFRQVRAGTLRRLMRWCVQPGSSRRSSARARLRRVRAAAPALRPAVGRARASDGATTRCSTCSPAAARRRSAASAPTLAPGTAAYVARGTAWRVDEADGARGSSPSSFATRCPPTARRTPSSTLDDGEAGDATAGRQFRLLATPERGLRVGDAVRRLHPRRPRARPLPQIRRGRLRARGRGRRCTSTARPRRSGRARACICRPASCTASRTPAPARCRCSASSGPPARRPRRTTPTARRAAVTDAADRAHRRRSSGKGTPRAGAARSRAAPGAFAELGFSLPTRIGKPEGKTSPEELLAAAHGGCITMSLAGELSKAGTPPGRLDVDVPDRDGRGRGAGPPDRRARTSTPSSRSKGSTRPALQAAASRRPTRAARSPQLLRRGRRRGARVRRSSREPRRARRTRGAPTRRSGRSRYPARRCSSCSRSPGSRRTTTSRSRGASACSAPRRSRAAEGVRRLRRGGEARSRADARRRLRARSPASSCRTRKTSARPRRRSCSSCSRRPSAGSRPTGGRPRACERCAAARRSASGRGERVLGLLHFGPPGAGAGAARARSGRRVRRVPSVDRFRAGSGGCRIAAPDARARCSPR